jgi:PAS domain S-box-containing protein
MKRQAPASPLTDYQSILDSISDGVLTTDHEMIITSFNRGAEQVTGVPRAEAIGRKCFEVMRAETCETDCCLKRTMLRGEPCINLPVHILRADNKRIPVSVTTNIMRDPQGRIIGGVETFRDLTEINRLRQAFHKQHSFESIVSKNPKMMQLFSVLPQIAESRSTVLIEGASGTGKELVARAIHNQGPRRKEPFVAVNCGALPDTLIESELFGYAAGAFTDAKRDKPGRFTLAGGGTVFLDEVGDISAAMQVRLLRVLENRSFSPLGATQSLHMKARVIAATHRDLDQMVERKQFRQDLYFRINVVRLKLPKLAERMEDIPLLVNHFRDQFNAFTGKRLSGVSEDAMAALALYHWPGNVRELENAMEHAFVLCREGVIGIEHLPEQVRVHRDPVRQAPGRSLAENEKLVILDALMRNGWRRMATARELEIDKNTLRRKIRCYGISPP